MAHLNQWEFSVPNPIQFPSGYAPAFAISYSDDLGGAKLVSNGQPMPVIPVAVNRPVALAGTASASGNAGPLEITAGRPVILTLSGTWTGTVTVQRSTDGGTTRNGLTAMGQTMGQFTTNACEPVWEDVEDGVQLYLNVALQSGSVTYRMGQ